MKSSRALTSLAGSFSGLISNTTVRSNDPAAPAVTLGIKANVRPLFAIEPRVVKLGVELGSNHRFNPKPAPPRLFCTTQTRRIS